ncbi:hypothetical protein [Sphingomonas sp.]|jgi:hypothetical protein|nr:hypothetical protein [Sphingomonas sp.]HEU0043549.1 hypothetical protein [Sphingomonas sp.]
MFGKLGQQFAAIVCTVLVSTACVVAAVGPATTVGQSVPMTARAFA